MAFTTVRSATGVDLIGTPEVDVGVIFNETGNVVVTGLGGADVIQINNSTNIQRTTTINGGDGADVIDYAPIFFGASISQSSINGNMGNDTIKFAVNSSIANSFVGGGAGDDVIICGNQLLATLVNGGAGADTIEVLANLALASVNGGDGNDTIKLFASPTGQTFDNSSINGNGGNDFIDAIGFVVTATGTNFIGGGAGDDNIDFTNATTDNNAPAFSKGFDLTGGSGNDIIYGSLDNDTISGNADNDTIFGNEGRDTIFAGAGKDTINVGRLNPVLPVPSALQPLDAGDVITGGAGGDIYAKFNPNSTATFNINSIAESAAATSGTAAAATLTFDSFINYAFAANDRLNISAVANQLAGGPLTLGAAVKSNNLGAFTATDFAALTIQLDALPLGPGPGQVNASTTSGINAYNFTATIGAPGSVVTASYLWIQDSQKAYSSSDLLFQTQALGGILPGQITLV